MEKRPETSLALIPFHSGSDVVPHALFLDRESSGDPIADAQVS